MAEHHITRPQMPSDEDVARELAKMWESLPFEPRRAQAWAEVVLSAVREAETRAREAR